MKANFVARKFVITDDIRDTFNKKFKRFDRFFPEDTEITATLKEERNGVRVELTIVDRGYFYRAEQSASEPIAAVDLCVDIIEGQIRKYNTKLEKRLRAGAFEDVADDADYEDGDINITQVKKFLYKPMSAEEAILQMNMLGHQFYVFKHEETDEVCVVYKKNKAGEYGLIQPVE